MSVLEEEECGVSELLRCKLDYLRNENNWMHTEYAFLCKLIDLQKQLIHPNPPPTLSADLNTLLAHRQQTLQQLQNTSHETTACELETDEFVPLIYSFEEKIERLQGEIKQREAALQEIELQKAEAEERRPEFKCISNYESQARLLDRLKRQIGTMQSKKLQLESQLLALGEKGEEESTVASQAQSRSKVQSAQDESSLFQRLIMLIKKKRYQNACLEQKIGRLKKGVQRKQAASAQLRREAQGLEWRCLEEGLGVCGFVQADRGDLSLAGKSFTNNTSFSFDVSRFIKPKRALKLHD